MRSRVFTSVLAAALVLGCSRTEPTRTGKSPARKPAAAKLAPGEFRLLAAQAADSGATYVAEVDEARGGCRFGIYIAERETKPGELFSFSKAALIRRPGANCSEFLKNLTVVLEAKSPIPSVSPVDRLDATVAIMGTKETRGAEGGFSSQPPGPWMPTKLFLADGEAEVYLNLNPVDGIGEFALKDADYAEGVLKELSKVLSPVR